MKRLKITLLFLSVFLETQAQKGFRTELYFDNKFKVIVLNHINTTDSLIEVPTFLSIMNHLVITYPNKDTFSYEGGTCVPSRMPLKPKQSFSGTIVIEELLESIDYWTQFSKKQKHLTPLLGVYMIDWIVEGQPTKTISIDYKGALKDKIPRKK